MNSYRVSVRQRVSDANLTKHDDRTDNPTGTYDYTASSAEDALEEFHNHISVACLDDFEITVEEVSGDSRTVDLPAQSVWVLHISHKHGENYYAFSTLDLARKAVEEWCRDYWKQEIREDLPPDLTGEDLVEQYFDKVAGWETYAIDGVILDRS